MKYSLALVLGLSAQLAFGALPPYWQRTREMSAIMNEQGIAEIVQDPKYRGKSSGVVDALANVTQTEPVNGESYLLTTGACTLRVMVSYEVPGEIAGPAKFKLHWQKKLNCPE